MIKPETGSMKGKDDMKKVISIKGLPDSMIKRILPEEVSDSEYAYSNIQTVLLIPEEDKTQVVFDIRRDWNYLTDQSAEELFASMAG